MQLFLLMQFFIEKWEIVFFQDELKTDQKEMPINLSKSSLTIVVNFQS